MAEFFIAILASLISVVNPLGVVPIYLSLTEDYTSRERASTSLQTTIYFIVILLIFFFGGNLILSFFGISVPAIKIAGGIVITNSAFTLLNNKFAKTRVSKEMEQEAHLKEDISFTPLAMPMLSGPGSISLLISMYAQHEDWNLRFIIAGVVILAGILVYFTLRASPWLNRLLGVSGLRAISRIMGFIVLAIGMQYIISGVVDLVTNYL